MTAPTGGTPAGPAPRDAPMRSTLAANMERLQHAPAPTADSPVPATITAAAAQAIAWQAIVSGAGPAGAAAAIRLAARGLNILLLDAAAMPRPKLCGCCLSGAAVRELSLLGEIAAGSKAAACRSPTGLFPPETLPLERVRLATAGIEAVLPLPGGGVISREALDTAAVRAAIAAGVAWLPETRAVSVSETEAEPARVVIAGRAGPSATLSGEVVIMAAGLADTVRTPAAAVAGNTGNQVAAGSRLGLGTTLPAGTAGPPRGELLMAVSRQGYCGVVRLEDGRIDIAAAVDRGLVASAGGPAAAVAAILTASGGQRAAGLPADLASLLAAASLRGTPPLTRRQPVASAAGRILRVGDAAGYVEPFTGEGMGWALASARLVDEALAPAVKPAGALAESPAGAAVRYATAHRRHFDVHHARCRRVSLVVRRPWLVGPALRLARLAPAVAARMVPLVVGAAAPGKAHG